MALVLPPASAPVRSTARTYCSSGYEKLGQASTAVPSTYSR